LTVLRSSKSEIRVGPTADIARWQADVENQKTDRVLRLGGGDGLFFVSDVKSALGEPDKITVEDAPGFSNSNTGEQLKGDVFWYGRVGLGFTPFSTGDFGPGLFYLRYQPAGTNKAATDVQLSPTPGNWPKSQPGQTPQQLLTSTNAGRVVVLTLEEAKRIVGERRTIEMPVPTACSIAGGEVLLQNAWGMIPTLASSFGFGSIGVQKDRLTSIPSPVILVVLSTNAVEGFRESGVADAQSHFLGSVVRATGTVEVLDAAAKGGSLTGFDSKLREFLVIRVNNSADLTIQKQK